VRIPTPHSLTGDGTALALDGRTVVLVRTLIPLKLRLLLLFALLAVEMVVVRLPDKERNPVEAVMVVVGVAEDIAVKIRLVYWLA
jgi:hypothetical protein